MNLKTGLSKAIKHFWKTRKRQQRRQGSKTGKKDQGSRSAVTGGAQLDGFISLVRLILKEAGINNADIHTQETILPGFFRPSKEWDLVVVVDRNLLATIEFKSHIGPSFGNNFNNRIEESLGSAFDFRTAYRDGAFKPSASPWLGYLILVEDTEGSNHPVKLAEPHFSALKEFSNTSYIDRYKLFCQKLVRERLYDATCFLTSSKKNGKQGNYKEPDEELSFEKFSTSLLAKAIAFQKSHR